MQNDLKLPRPERIGLMIFNQQTIIRNIELSRGKDRRGIMKAKQAISNLEREYEQVITEKRATWMH